MPYSLGIFVWNFYQTFVTVCIEFGLIFEPHIRPTILARNFLLITARAEMKVRLCVKLFDFFRGWILICLTWYLWRFVPNSVDIRTCNFTKKIFRDNFSEIFVQTKAILYQNLWNFALYCVEKIHASIFMRSSLCLLSWGWDLRPIFVPQDWEEIFYWSLLELKGKFISVWNCLIFFMGEYSSVRPDFGGVLSQIQWKFLREISGKNYFRRIFQKVTCKPRLSSTKTCAISP